MSQGSGRMSPKTRAILEPFGEAYLELYRSIIERIDESTPEERAALWAACRKTSSTNCGWHVFDAAELIRKALPTEVENIEEDVALRRRMERLR